MKTHSQPLSKDLPGELRTYLNTVAPLGVEDVEELQAAANELDADPAFQADYLKGLFIEKILEALQERHETQSDLARRWGKSRQYVSKLFNESNRVNFTIETLCQMARQVGLRVEIRVVRPSETASAMSCGATEAPLLQDTVLGTAASSAVQIADG